MTVDAGVKKPGENVVNPGNQTEKGPAEGLVVLGRVIDACRISQIEGTERSASPLVSVVCRAKIENDAKV